MVFMPILVQDSTGATAQAEAAARVDDRLDLSVPILADHEGVWLSTWGAANGTSAHSYALLDATGRLLWRRHDGGSSSVDEMQAVVASELD